MRARALSRATVMVRMAMRIPRDFPKIEKACAREASRYALTDPWLTEDAPGVGHLNATDGRVLARVPVEIDGDTVGNVPTEAIVRARTNLPAVWVTLNGNATVHAPGGTVTMAIPDGTAPDLGGIMPSKQSAQAGSVLVIGLNAELLWNLAQALHRGHVAKKKGEPLPGYLLRLQIALDDDGDCTSPVRVDPILDRAFPGAHGAIMPVSCE